MSSGNFTLFGAGCDVTLKIDNVELPAHKAVLATHSPVFANMFKERLAQGRHVEVEVKIAGGKADHLRFVLSCMYRSGWDRISKPLDVIKVYEILQMYDIQWIKEVCLKTIEENLCPKLIVKIIHNESVLRNGKEVSELVAAYMSKYSLEVFATDEWKYLELKRGDLTSRYRECIDAIP